MNLASPQTFIKCNQCGSPLIVVKKKTQKIENYLSPITVTFYKCSNKDCQTEIDKKTKQRIKLQKEQQSAKDERVKTKKETDRKAKSSKVAKASKSKK